MRSPFYVALFLAGSVAQGQSLCDSIQALTADPTVASAHWGVSVTTLDGTKVCGVNDAQLFRPASNNKIFTSAAAMALLGPERRFTTSVMAQGKLAGSDLKGDLKGDLVLMGGGDANFGGRDIPYVPPALRVKNPAPEPPTIADIEAMAVQIAATGLKTVNGDVVGDDTQFAWEPYPPDWTIDDAVYGYGAPVSGLTIHDNELEVQVTPNPDLSGGSHPPALVATVPAVPYYALQNEVLTRDMGHDCDAHLGFQRAPGSKLLAVYGDMPPGVAICRQAVAINDPAEYAAQALKLALERHGVRVTGTFRARHMEANTLGSTLRNDPALHLVLTRLLAQPLPANLAPVACEASVDGAAEAPQTVLATHQSPKLVEDVTYTMKVSQNLHAELLLRNLGAAYSCDHTQAAGLQVVREYILHAGVLPGDFALYDGSGLSAHDLVTPRAFTTFLHFASTQPWFEAWRAALPGGGTDGTLVNRFGKTLGPRVQAKTGTLSETRALSGFVTTAGGQTMIFSVMVDTHLPGTGDDRAVMDKIVQAIGGQN